MGGHSQQIIITIPIYRNSRLGLAGRGINFRMIKVNNKSGGPDTRHLISPDTNQCQGYTPYVDSTATINQRTTGSGTQHKTDPARSSVRVEITKQKLPQNGPTIRPRKSTNTQAYNEWITTDTSHKHNRRRDGRRAKSNNDGTATKKKKKTPRVFFFFFKGGGKKKKKKKKK